MKARAELKSMLMSLGIVAVLFSVAAVEAAPPRPPSILDKTVVNGVSFDQDGWAILTDFLVRSGPQIEQSRLVYISAQGSDTEAASNQHGRGYYLPGDPEIGADPAQPAGVIRAYRTFTAARKAVRNLKEWGNYQDGGDERRPDWMLFNRGDVFDLEGLGLVETWVGGGVSRRVFTAYGDVRKQRPKLINTAPRSVWPWGEPGGNGIAVTALDLSDAGTIQLLGAKNVLIEDVKFRHAGIQGMGNFAVGNVIVRRCTVVDSFNLTNAHSTAVFVADASDLIWISENTFDMNGYFDDPQDPGTWTGGVVSRGNKVYPPGSGVQPTRTWFSRPLYLSSYQNMLVEGNLISRGAGGDSVQMRVGGVARGNTFLWNHTALSLGHAEAKRDRLQDGLVEQNLVLHDEHFLPPGGWGNGFILGAGDQETATARDNLVLHFHRGTNGGAMIMARGMPGNPQERAKAVSIIDNVLVSHETPPIRLVAGLDNPWGVATATVAGNAIYWPEGKSAAISDVPPKPDLFQIGSTAVGGNAYFMPQWPGLSAWQQLGFDQASTAYSSAPAMAAAKGWRPNAAQLDIVSYVRSIDPTYQPDENVTVDFGVPDAKRNPNAPKVWEVLMDPTRFGGDLPKMTEERAKLTARRFHAFVTFIQRARLNRRGNWDERYTSQAINNYFRGAFGRKPYLGPVAAPR